MSVYTIAINIRQRALLGYLLAILSCVLALLIRIQLGQSLSGFPFLTFFAAVLFTAFFCGVYPALLAIALTSLMADYYLIEPSGSLGLNLPSGAIALGLYLLITLGFTAIMNRLIEARLHTDSTEELLAQRALTESERQFSILVQGVRDYAIYMLDQEGHITNWNSGAELIKGYTAEEIIGQHFSRFYTRDDRAAGEPANALATALREGKYEREARRVRKDGSLFWASVVIDPIFDGNGDHVGFAKITRDISERKESELELERARETLAQAQKLQALGEFTGGIAHDFNNLMTVIVGAADFLLKNPDLSAEKREKYLRSVADTADRATDLTDHLLAFARRQSLRPEVIDLRIRMDAFGEVVGRLLGSQISVVIDICADEPIVEVDPSQLETALLNASINARDAMPDGGELRITTSECEIGEKPGICIAVKDSGIGIPTDQLARVFEPFYTTKAAGKGTGLGLSQIHGFAAQAGGDVEIDSQPGRGTTLLICLPRSYKQVSDHEDEIDQVEFPRELRVLIAEDNNDVRLFAIKLLGDLGCQTEAVQDGRQAIERLRAEEFDLLFSDVMMPHLNGLELAKKAEEEGIECAIVLCSGYSDELIGDLPRDLVVVRKPYDIVKLQQAIMRALALSQKQKTGRRQLN